MRKGRYAKRGGASKLLVVMLSLVLVIGCVVGGTLAWLTATSSEVKNTFTTSDIGVTLEETKTDFQMVPGHTITKDPKASVTAGSEEAWLFVKIEESDNFNDYMTYEIATGWELVTYTTNVYARKVDGTTNTIGMAYSILKDDQVTVLGSVTKQMMETAKNNQPTLTFTAYASQLMKNNTEEFTAAEAWANVANPAGTTGN